MSKRTKEVLNGPHEKIGVATLLPEDAAAVLVRAADKARTLPIGSLARAKCLADATSKVRFVYPLFFKFDDEEEASSGGRKAEFGLFCGQGEDCSE